VICQKFLNFVQKKCKTCAWVHLNILCLVCINLHYTLNYAEFDKKCVDFTQFLLKHAVKVTTTIICTRFFDPPFKCTCCFNDCFPHDTRYAGCWVIQFFHDAKCHRLSIGWIPFLSSNQWCNDENKNHFTALCPNYPLTKPAPEETFTQSHLSWSSFTFSPFLRGGLFLSSAEALIGSSVHPQSTRKTTSE